MQTFRRSLSSAFLVAIATVAAIAAGTAQATTVSRMVDHDDVSTLGSGSFEFRNGALTWWYDSEISAHLTGEIKLNDANGSCARMRIEYFNDSVSITTKYGGTGAPAPRLELAIGEHLAWFNNERLHTSLGGVPPAEYEEVHSRR